MIAGKERPHPGAQLRITDVDGHRVTAFATNTKTGGVATQLADLELRHRRRARCEDRIRVSKDTGLMNLPLQGFDQNRIWCAIVALAVEITAWMQMLALNDHQARRWEPKRLRLRLFTLPATIARTGRQVRLHPATKAPWSSTKAYGGYGPSRSPGKGSTSPVPTTTVLPPATWNRRPPETTLGPPSHPNDKINSSRRPSAAATLKHPGRERSRLTTERY